MRFRRSSWTPFNGCFHTIDYAYWKRAHGGATLVPITDMEVNAQIARPGFAELVRGGEAYHMSGAAWTAEASIIKAGVSVDRGATWHPARFPGEAVPNAWQLWEYAWQVPIAPGKATETARATESKGRTQPIKRDRDMDKCIVNHVLPIEVTVR